MGKAARCRRERQNEKATATKEALRLLGPAEAQKAINQEINRQCAEAGEQFIQNELAVVLWALHTEFGFGRDRLARFVRAYEPEWKKLQQHYEMSENDVPWLCKEKSESIWTRRIGSERERYLEDGADSHRQAGALRQQREDAQPRTGK